MGSDIASGFKENDYIYIKNESGVNVLKINQDAYFSLLDEVAPVEVRKNTFRGKNLGDRVTDEQYARIADGSFKGFFIGDYWLINNIHWRIADMDYWIGSGLERLTYHHLTIFPDEPLLQSSMNDTMTNDGGYIGSKLYQEKIPYIVDNILKPIFDRNNGLLTHEDWFSNLVTNGIVTGGSWTKAVTSLPTESMIIGSRHFTTMSSENTPTSGLYTTSYEQLSLFKLEKNFEINKFRSSYWTRDAAYPGYFVVMDFKGHSNTYYATVVMGVRPVFGIKGFIN